MRKAAHPQTVIKKSSTKGPMIHIITLCYYSHHNFQKDKKKMRVDFQCGD